MSDKIKKTHDKVIFTYGRFNPPHSGHAKLIRRLEAEPDADAYAFVTSTQDRKKNPLDVATKVAYLNKMNPDTRVKIINTTECDCRLVQQVVRKLKEAGYTDLNMIVGKDRRGQFAFLEKEGVQFVDDESLNRADGMSATKMRNAATAKNRNTFAAGTKLGRMNNSNVDALLSQVRVGLGLSARGGARTKKLKRRRSGY